MTISNYLSTFDTIHLLRYLESVAMMLASLMILSSSQSTRAEVGQPGFFLFCSIEHTAQNTFLTPMYRSLFVAAPKIASQL